MKTKNAALVDSHCHIDLFPEPMKLVEEAETNRVYTLAVTNTPSVFSHTEFLAKDTRYVRAAVGLHPQLSASRHQELPQLWEILSRTRYVGEIGLDYQTLDESNRRLQRTVLEQILKRCAEYGNKVLTVHSRRAADDVISMVGNNFPGKVILHWFSGSLRDLRRAIDYGFYFSANTAMVSSKKGQRLLKEIPQNRLLTETDGPFIKTNGAPCSPSTIAITVNNMSPLFKISPNQLRTNILCNFRDLLIDDDSNHSD